MNEVTVSNLDDATIQRLQRRADAHGRTVQDEIRHILTCGLDGLEFAEKAFRELKEKAEIASQLATKVDVDAASLRAKMKQMLMDGRERDAQFLDDMDKDIEDAKAMIGKSIPKEVSQSGLISFVEAVVDEKVQAGEMFTAHDVTLEVRKREHRANHNEVREAVHDYYGRDGLGVAYTRTTISLPGGQPFLYHRTVDDSSTYLNIRDADQPGTSQGAEKP